MNKENPLETLFGEMNAAVEAGFSVVALSVAVSIPAICASLSMSSGRSGGNDYKDWCRENLRPDNGFQFLSPEELYSIRNGLLHQGRGEIASYHKGEYTHPYPHTGAIFTLENGFLNMGENSCHDQYVNSVKAFCRSMTDAARAWLQSESGNQTVQENLAKMMTYKPFQAPGISIEPTPQAIY